MEEGNVHSGSVTESARMSYEHAREAARQAVGQVKDQAASYYARGKETAKQWQDGSEQYIQENPIKSVLIAAGAGLVLGLLLRKL